MTTEPTRRLFFALWPDKLMQSALADATRAIADACDGRAVPAENFHLTLAFLGSVPESKLADLSRIAGAVADAFRSLPSRSSPIVITLDKAEHWRKPEVLCATGLEPPPAAVALAQVLKEALVAGGFAPDLKPFRVHATLARKVRRVSGALTMLPIEWSFAEFHLIESRTDPKGSSYSTIQRWSL